MRPNSYTRRDLMASLWRIFGSNCRTVHVKLVPGSEFVSVTFELTDPIGGDEVFHLKQTGQNQYEEKRHEYHGPRQTGADTQQS